MHAITGIVLLHGLGADHHEPLDLLSPALPRGVPVLAPDMRAHGRSALIGAVSDFTVENLAHEAADCIIEWMRNLPPDGFGDHHLIVAGVSAGALLALRLAAVDSLPIERVVYIRPAFTERPVPPNLRALPLIAELLESLGPVDGEQQFTASQTYRRILKESPLGARSLVSQFRAPDAVLRCVRLREIPRNVAFTTDFIAPRQQALIVSSVGDPIHPAAVADLWSRHLPQATRVSVPNRDTHQRLFTDGIRRCVQGWLAN